ncbi:MAG: hypothetical protein HY788_02235 [Deltaproteobacteria bacterium]|nr:hypothetical protein [Deltaproteobacteria bacterium]
MKQPSRKELSGKLARARQRVASSSIEVVDQESLVADLLDLGYLVEDLPSILRALLDEVREQDYSGGNPPQRSYKEVIRDSELFAFTWWSKRLGCRAYLKFALKGNTLWLVSLHEARKP